MPVIIESAGDHAFDLGHIRRQGGEELVRLLLEKAGLHLHLTWRVQVQKKLTCTAETPPVRVVDEPRKWAVHLKIKPGDNNTCHLCSLLMPDGLRGPTVYYLLGKATINLDRNWRNRTVEPSNGTNADRTAELFPRIPPVNPPVASAQPDQPMEDEREAISFEPVVSAAAPDVAVPLETPEAASPRTSPARGWLHEPDRMRLLLLAIHEINEGGAYPQEQWAELLCQRMGWEGANRHEVGGVLTGLVRKNLIERRFRGSKPYGYLLSGGGRGFIADLVPPPLVSPSSDPFSATSPASASAALAASLPRTTGDPAEIIRSFGPIAKQFLEANARLEEIAKREAELTGELNKLRQERDRICRLFENNQVQSVLAALARFVQPTV